MLVLQLLLAFGASPAAPSEIPVDVSGVRSELRVLQAGPQRYVVLAESRAAKEHLYWGDGKTFHRLLVESSGRDGEGNFSFAFWDPRIPYGAQRLIDRRDGAIRVTCEDRKTPLVPVEPKAAEALLAQARFFEARWERRAHALARDDRGVYYYVDRLAGKDRKGFRLFRGQKGRLVELPMLNIVSDSAGDVFATKKGELRLVLGKKEYFWIRGKRRTELVALPLFENARLIYIELGVYLGQPLGTPCDQL